MPKWGNPAHFKELLSALPSWLRCQCFHWLVNMSSDLPQWSVQISDLPPVKNELCMIFRFPDTKETPKQIKTRFVLSAPTVDGLPCPALVDTRLCQDLPKCSSYHWKISEWSNCMFLREYDQCGHGFKARGKAVLFRHVFLKKMPNVVHNFSFL